MLDFDVSVLKNQYTENALLAKKNGFKILIFGAGTVGQIVEKKFLEPYGVYADFFVEDDKFYRNPREVCDIPVIPFSKVNKDDEKILLMIAFDYDKVGASKIPFFDIKGQVFVGDFGSFTHCRNGLLDSSFFETHKKEFEETYDMLNDKESKDVMVSFLKSRLTCDTKYLNGVWKNNQYFEKNIVDFHSIKNYVDCGAYIGDTYDELVNKSAVNGEKIDKAWLFEPEDNNVSILKEKYSSNPCVSIIPKGAWNEKTILFFNGGGSSGGIDSTGIKVEVDSIDNVCNGQRVDFIKMDIEGSEYKALLGAERTIKTFAPTLAICVYHRKEDLINIPKLIKSYRNDYVFFLRTYRYISQELVLYAKKMI